MLKVSEIELEKNENEINVCVFVSFNISSLLDTADPLQFYHWMLAKSLKALINKLRRRGMSIPEYSIGLLSNDLIETEDNIERSLSSIVKSFENSYRKELSIVGSTSANMDSLPDIEDVKVAIEDICENNSINKIFFFFDEAAHVFRPNQQRQFFSLFKDLRSPYIVCNAAIYPGVTHFGKSFEPIHDCMHLKLERDIRQPEYLDYFKDIVFKQISNNRKEQFEKNKDIFNTLVFSSGGNPRILLRTIQELDKINTTNINSLIKSFYRQKIWSEHTELGDKYKGHKKLIDWGRDFLEVSVIPAIERYNQSRRSNKIDESTIYFWVHKDCPELVKESLRLLTYTGIIRVVDSSIRATRSELGTRYEVKYGCILSMLSSPAAESSSLYNSISIKKFPEFGRNHPSYSKILEIDGFDNDSVPFNESISDIMDKSISVLQLLTDWQKNKLIEINIITIGQLYEASENSLIEKIYNVGAARARLMKNAADAEILEYISG
ncbi:hypothetical protein I5456_14685 [Citrobacter freundii]|nr:hypothetical protein [Citrobacter freundii]HCB1649219.1 hypothetical protein [Citrobacter freundii]